LADAADLVRAAVAAALLAAVALRDALALALSARDACLVRLEEGVPLVALEDVFLRVLLGVLRFWFTILNYTITQ
jgi:hypothetical protein